MIALGLGVFIGGFDQTFVVPVLTEMLGDLGVAVNELEQASWILNGYLLGYTVALPLMGRLADVHGHYRIFVIGMLIFMGGSVFVAFAPNITVLPIARAVTALGGGALVPVGLAIAAHALTGSQRTIGLGSISTLDDASSLAGPLWGTLIGVWLGWRGLFWMNIVLALPILILVLFLARRASAPPRSDDQVDWLGGLLLSLSLGALTFAIAGAGESLRELWTILLLYAAAAFFMALFVWRQLRVAAPLIDMRMFRIRRVALANVVFLLEGMALITALVNVPLMAQVVWGLEGTGPGLMLGRMVLFMAVGGIAGGALATIAGYRLTTLVSFVIAAAGLFAMAGWASEPSQIALWTALGLAGLGFTLADASLYA
ncbi:MAG: MFS transporter, partial [Dehalococcoidia bacterium]|nr:MFS transporter [Dehalococcoidia bacterium]